MNAQQRRCGSSESRETGSKGDKESVRCSRASPEGSDGCRRVENDLGSVQAVHEPVERVVAPVADVHRDPPEVRLEHRVSHVSLHVIGRLSLGQRPRLASPTRSEAAA